MFLEPFIILCLVSLAFCRPDFGITEFCGRAKHCRGEFYCCDQMSRLCCPYGFDCCIGHFANHCCRMYNSPSNVISARTFEKPSVSIYRGSILRNF
uniref:Cysteine rich secreted protein n=1 Tax=Riptortus pedestris TaxID=329032 RepID=R4WCX5_RIPPE|nr:cysteine rich secreted protein [Riptortus pedestris]